MQVDKKSLTTAKSAKDYLSKNEIPQLFECLMTGLMYHRPSDHITYLQDCLERIKKQGVNGVRWDMFLEAKKTPLPPIESTPREDYRPQPLPDIGSLQLRMAMDASIIIVQTGPGMDKKDIVKHLCTSFPNYVQIELGTLLRERALMEAQDKQSRWKSVRDVINEGDLVSEEFVIETLIKELNNYSEKTHFIIEGYPRTTKEREDFERFIGLNRVKFMLLVDCEEDLCQRQLADRPLNSGWSDNNPSAINKRILNYKMNTLAVCKYFDDQNKLRVVDGDNNRDLVMKDIHLVFTKELNEPICPHPPSSPKHSPSPELEPSKTISPGREPVTDIEQLTDISTEQDRNPELPQCCFILILGGPGSGKSEVATRVCDKHEFWVHVDVNEVIRSKVMNSESPNHSLAICDGDQSFVENWTINIDALKEVLKSIPEESEVVILEGFPKNPEQLNQFNTEIGRADVVVLLDSEEEVMRTRLGEKFCRIQEKEDEEINVDLRILHFKQNGLSICRYYDELNNMCIVAADRDILDVVSDFDKVTCTKLKLIKSASVVKEMKDSARSNNILDDEVSNAAAIKIQASARGYMTRKHLNEKALKDQNNNAIEGDDDIGEEDGENKKINSVFEENDDENKDIEENILDMKEDVEENNEEPIEESEEIIEDEILADESKVVEEDIVETEENIEVEDVIEPVHVSLLGYKGVRTTSQMELMNAHVVFLLGGPGSGKTTLGSHLVSTFAISFIHVNQIVKEAIESEDEESEELQKYLLNKECDETRLYSLIRKSLMDCLSVSKVIFVAGFPRTVEQYQRFIYEVCPVSASIFLDVDETTLKNRLAARADPELPLDYVDELESFMNNNPALLKGLNETELFSKVDGTLEVSDVLQQVSDIVEHFSFMRDEE